MYIYVSRHLPYLCTQMNANVYACICILMFVCMRKCMHACNHMDVCVCISMSGLEECICIHMNCMCMALFVLIFFICNPLPWSWVSLESRDWLFYALMILFVGNLDYCGMSIRSVVIASLATSMDCILLWNTFSNKRLKFYSWFIVASSYFLILWGLSAIC